MAETAFPLDEKKLPFNIPRGGAKREKLAKLARMITDRVPAKLKGIETDDPEYWGLAGCVTDEMCDVALKMKVRKPKTFEQIQQLTHIEPEHLQELLDQMSWIGLVEYNWENLDGKNPNHEKRYVLPAFVPGSAEFFNMRTSQIDEHPEVTAFFERMTFLPLEHITPMVPPGGAGIGMHVIPVEREVSMENEAISLEKISYWLDKYEGKYAASMCSCRASRAKMGEGSGDDAEDWCIAVGDMADYVVETERGRYITKEEALDIFKRAEKNGYVHQITNIDGEQKIFAICNCNVNICNALRTSQLFNTPNMSRSAYVAHVDKQKCVACGQCVEVCPAGAIKLGQKLCLADGTAITYPKQELPDETPWGPEKWAIDYRNKNRINTHETGTAPCKSACPAHIAVQGYLKLAAQGEFQKALELIKKENPLPAVCGRICNRRCEEACTRATIDQAVAIDEVKKYIAQLDLDAQSRFIPEKVIPKVEGGFDEKIAIIGAGPAGLTCAYYLALKGYTPVVFDKNEDPGGMLRYGVPSYKLDPSIIDAEVQIMQELGVQFKFGAEVGKDITLDDLRNEGFKAFYIAIGCQGSRLPGVEGERAEGCWTAVDFLHAAKEKKQPQLSGDCVVVGGGNVAIDAARTAKRLGAAHVSIFCLEPANAMLASPEEIAEAEEEGISIYNEWGPARIIESTGVSADAGENVEKNTADAGENEDKNTAASGQNEDKSTAHAVTGVDFKRCISLRDKDGRFAPLYDEENIKHIDCSTVVFSIGQAAKWDDLLGEDSKTVELSPQGYAIADTKTYQTTQPDIFVGGDILTGPRFAIDAIAQGKEAATSLHRFVQPNASLTVGRDARYFKELDKDNIRVGEYDSAKRQIAEIENKDEWKRSFTEAKTLFTAEQVKKETARCLGCGAAIVDENKCIGCGLCTTRCNFDAIHLKRDRPECSTMYKSEDKMKAILPYMLKRSIKVKRAKKASKKSSKREEKKA